MFLIPIVSFPSAEPQDSFQGGTEVLCIICAFGFIAATRVEIVIIVECADSQIFLKGLKLYASSLSLFLTTHVRIGAGDQLIEDVEVAFTVPERNHTGFLQQKVGYFPPNRLSAPPEYDLDILSEPAYDMK